MNASNHLSILFVASLLSTYSPLGVAQNCGQSDPEKQRTCESDEALKKEFAEFEATREARLAKVRLERRAEDSERVASLSQKEFCIYYGDIARGGKPRFLLAEGYGDGDLISIFKKQSRQRKLSLDDKHVKDRTIRIGMTTCMLYAALGNPQTENRTTGSWGQHIQHVYRNSDFVYSENGRVTAWQD